MQLTTAHLEAISGGKVSPAKAGNMRSIIAGLDTWGLQAGLLLPERLCHYVSQLAHESGRFLYDRELWGPTAAQARYDTRTDLGNTAAADGDGKFYMGRSGIQLTGKANYRAFRDWCRAQGLNPPDFVAYPDQVNTDPWEGLVPIWYWTVGNPTGKSLNVYADANNIEMVTRRINGGTNGLDDRVELFTRTGLVFLGYALGKGVVARFQNDAGMTGDDVDDIPGPKTREALQGALKRLEAANDRPALPTAPVAPPVARETIADHIAEIERRTAAILALAA